MPPLNTSTSYLEAILNSPVRDPPPGITQHIDAHREDEYWYYITNSLCFAIISIMVILRAYTKIKIIRKYEAADYFIILTYLFCIVVGVLGIVQSTHGQGADIWNLKVKEFIKLRYYMNIMEILYGLTLFTVKISIVLQYIRLFAPNRTVSPFVFYSSWIIIISHAMFYSAYTFATIFACMPREKIWNERYPGGQCLNHNAVVVSTGLFNIVSDVVILLLPVKTVWGLRIPTQKKVSISALFGTGLLACVASVMRVQYAMKITLYGTKVNVTYYVAHITIWSNAEIAAGVFVACMLTAPKLWQGNGDKIRNLFSKIFPCFRSNPPFARHANSIFCPLPPVKDIGIWTLQLERVDSLDSDKYDQDRWTSRKVLITELPTRIE